MRCSCTAAPVAPRSRTFDINNLVRTSAGWAVKNPKVVYDPFSSRFILAVVQYNTARSGCTNAGSQIEVVASNADPTTAWQTPRTFNNLASLGGATPVALNVSLGDDEHRRRACLGLRQLRHRQPGRKSDRHRSACGSRHRNARSQQRTRVHGGTAGCPARDGAGSVHRGVRDRQRLELHGDGRECSTRCSRYTGTPDSEERRRSDVRGKRC